MKAEAPTFNRQSRMFRTSSHWSPCRLEFRETWTGSRRGGFAQLRSRRSELPGVTETTVAPSPSLLEPAVLVSELGQLRPPVSAAYLWGALPPRPRVAIVGSRRASSHGLEVARCVARRLAAEGVCIVSGGAAGIDRAAHEGALEAGGQTLVVGPVWLDHAYPVENRQLFAEILKRGGGYLTTCDAAAQPLRPFFHRRNAALVCLSDCLLIGESGRNSGALNAAATARALGRTRFVLPWRGDLPGTLGSECELLARGAVAYFRIRQVLDLLDSCAFPNPAWMEVRSQRQRRSPGNRAPGRACTPAPRQAVLPAAVHDSPRNQLLQALRGGSQTVDALCSRTEMSVQLVQHELLLMTLEGLVRQRGGFVDLIDPRRAESLGM